MRKFFAVLQIAALILAPAVFAPRAHALSRVAGRFVAADYRAWGGTILLGNTSTGTQTITVQVNGSLPDGRAFPAPYAGQIVSVDVGINNESVTLTAVSTATCTGGGGNSSQSNCYSVTGSFNNTHGASQALAFATSSGGLDEAIYDAYSNGGGTVVVDNAWTGSNSNITAATVFGNVAIEDERGYASQYWVPVGGATTLAAPTTLTSSTVGDGLSGTAANTTGGHYTNAAAYYGCIAYVDIMGQEGPCSATYNFTPAAGSTNQIGFTAPAASTGAVGYTIYISLTSGSYNLSYKVPLATYSAGIPTSNGVCTLTKLEVTTAACALSNTVYNQSGSQAVVSALTLNTSPIAPQSTVVSTTSVYIPNAGGRTTYAYTPSSHVGIPGLPVAFTPFTISAADATTVPSVLGTINLPANFMNFAGRGIEVCGYATTSASTGTIQDIQLQWDSLGQNTAGKGVQIADLTVTKTATSVLQLTFCAPLQTTVSGTSATAGSIQQAGGFITSSIASLSAAAAGGPTIAGATASLDLANEARLNIIYVHTTGTDGTALTLQSVFVRPL